MSVHIVRLADLPQVSKLQDTLDLLNGEFKPLPGWLRRRLKRVLQGHDALYEHVGDKIVFPTYTQAGELCIGVRAEIVAGNALERSLHHNLLLLGYAPRHTHGNRIVLFYRQTDIQPLGSVMDIPVLHPPYW